jgi:hypothetical protein
MAIALLLTVHLGIPLCDLFIKDIARPFARGAGRALGLGVQGSVERFFRGRHARADRKIGHCSCELSDNQRRRFPTTDKWRVQRLLTLFWRAAEKKLWMRMNLARKSRHRVG